MIPGQDLKTGWGSSIMRTWLAMLRTMEVGIAKVTWIWVGTSAKRVVREANVLPTGNLMEETVANVPVVAEQLRCCR